MKILLYVLLLIHCAVYADATLAPHLPAENAVKEALLASPLIHAAQAKKNAWTARAQAIDAGNAEFTLRSTAQHRRDVATRNTMYESLVSIERPIRLWGKRTIDADLSTKTQVFAEIEFADAMHEGSRDLLKLWFAYKRALADEKNAGMTLDLARKMLRLTQSQLKQGEISNRDAELAKAEFERISAMQSIAQAQRASAATAISRRYPTLVLPQEGIGADNAPLPQLMEPMEHMRDAFLEKNHELHMMRSEAQRLKLVAERMSRDRYPDPTIGAFSGRERAGSEQTTGVMLSVPFPSAYRGFSADAAFADALVAQDKILLAQQQLGAYFEDIWIQFQHKRDAAENLKSAYQRQALAAEKSTKAYTLGEGTLSDLLLIARMASDNLHACERMQLEVIELLALIRLDMHQIWDFDDM